MTKREKAIVFVMALAIIYGVYEFFIAPSFKKPQTTGVNKEVVTDGTNKLAEDIARVLKKDDSARVDAYIAARAEEEWTTDPFRTGDCSLGGKKASFESRGKNGLVYSGYLDIGKRRIGIINGTDYQIGDELEMGGYMVKSITPSKVIIVDRKGSTEIVVPFLEE